MARARSRLTARTVATVREPGRYADGGGLYLVVDAVSRRWVFRYTIDKKTRDMGLGSARDVTLAEAREMADEARRLVQRREDPLEARRSTRRVRTFRECAEAYLAAKERTFRNAKHRQQWHNTLLDLAASLGPMPVDKVATEHVLQVLSPIWTKTPETASRLRGRIERVLDAAKAAGERSGENPARWRGHLAHLLPQAPRSRRHHAALPVADAPAFLARLRQRDSVSARALEWTILTASRTSETLLARWSELQGDVWVVPADRMKARREHRVPLTARCLDIADEMRRLDSAWLFPGEREGRPLSQMAMLMLLRDMAPGLTVHGFRSTFRDWAGDRTHFDREVIEAALAHRIGNRTEQAYRREDALDKRRRLMVAWAGFLDAGADGARVVRLAR